jgi:hypothetical protein
VAHTASPTPVSSREVGALRAILGREPAVERGDRHPKISSDLPRWQATAEEPLGRLYFAVRHQASTTAVIPCCCAVTSPARCADLPLKRRRGQAAEPARLACPAPVRQSPPRSRRLVASRSGHEHRLPGCPVAGTVSGTADRGRRGLVNTLRACDLEVPECTLAYLDSHVHGRFSLQPRLPT